MRNLIDAYYLFRGLKDPNADEALFFANSELGELNDAHVHQRGGWIRNNDRERNLSDEVGDLYMMLDRYCKAAGLPEPTACLRQKMSKKGFSPAQANTEEK